MTIYYKKGDAIKGDKIIGEARKLSKPRVIAKSGRHSAQRIILIENSFCIIDKELRFLPQKS